MVDIEQRLLDHATIKGDVFVPAKDLIEARNEIRKLRVVLRNWRAACTVGNGKVVGFKRSQLQKLYEQTVSTL